MHENGILGQYAQTRKNYPADAPRIRTSGPPRMTMHASDALTTPPAPSADRSASPSHDAERAALRLFLGYRVTLAAILLVFFFAGGRGGLGSHVSLLFSMASVAYMIATLAALMFSLLRFVKPATQALLAMLTDIGLFTLLVFASGGVASGLGLPIAVSLTLGATLVEARAALAVAALAALAMLGEELFARFYVPFPQTAFMQAGFLGMGFFTLVLLAISFRSRTQRSEELIEQRETELVNLAQLSELVIQQMQAGVVVVDNEGIVQLINESAWVLLGLPTYSRHHPLRSVSPALADRCEEWRATRGEGSTYLRTTINGRDLRAEFSPLGRRGDGGTLIVLEDVSQLTEQAQRMKLASLGRLTAGIAHEIRNPLGAISHAAQLLEESPDLPDADRRLIEIIRHNSRRVNEVIESILKLSRQDLPKPRPLVLKPWLEQILAPLHDTLGLRPGQISLEVDPADTTIHADEGQLRQILEILCENAVRHFPRDPQTLRILVLAGITPESAGPYIEVRDNGDGIDDAAIEKLFDPFFTTHNQGTGLGLYIARQLGEANRVRLEYRKSAGGACFRLTFARTRGKKI